MIAKNRIINQIKEINLKENSKYLTEQIISYIGNKRIFIKPINNLIQKTKKELNKEKLSFCDVFSGSGSVSRMFKEHADLIVANDYSEYSYYISNTFLRNKSEIDFDLINFNIQYCNSEAEQKKFIPGIIQKNYAPFDDKNFQLGKERFYYTTDNAKRIDLFRKIGDSFLFGVLLYKMSRTVNAPGFFNSFFKKIQEPRVEEKIELEMPVISNFECDYKIYKKKLPDEKIEEEFDICFLDPPYNQKPYASSYFLLDLIMKNELPSKITKVSGLPINWERSNLNKKYVFLESFEKILDDLNTKYYIITYNNNAQVSLNNMTEFLKKYGNVEYEDVKHQLFVTGKNNTGKNNNFERFYFVRRK